jgi:glycosyltransferase involved in cell wall biosynthesis
MAQSPRVAIVHDWMVKVGGGEKVLYQLHLLYPEAPIYTTAYVPELFPEFKGADIRTTWMDRFSVTKYRHQFFPPLRAITYALMDLSNYDIVISSSTAESKYVHTGKSTLHLCYCHTPIRYYWSDYSWYLKHPPFGRLNWIAQVALPLVIGPLRWFDFKRAQAIDAYVANSKFVQKRINKYYHRESEVIYPPVSTDMFKLASGERDYYLIVGRQVAYKRLDLAVDAFNELGLPLKVAGGGEEVARQQLRAKSNIEFLGPVSDQLKSQLYTDAKGFVFPAVEDFGIVPLEAMASGTPVIAIAEGGALETVVEGKTGTFFNEQSPAALVAAIRKFEKMIFDPELIRAHALTFDEAVFREKMRAFVDNKWQNFSDKRTN